MSAESKVSRSTRPVAAVHPSKAEDLFSFLCSLSLENLEQIQELIYEDSSSVSSGVSENFDEISTDDLTGSSLSDQQFSSPYGSRRAPQGAAMNSRMVPSGLPAHHGTRMPAGASRGGQVPPAGGSHGQNRQQPIPPTRTTPMNPALASQRHAQQSHYAAYGNVPGASPQRGHSGSGAGATYRHPLTSNTLKLLKNNQQITSPEGAPGCPKSPVAPITGIRRPGSAAGSHQPPQAPFTNGQQQYHSLSLDRKRHLMTHGGPELQSYEGESFYTMDPRSGLSNVYETSAGTALAMLSPRNTLTKGSSNGAGASLHHVHRKDQSSGADYGTTADVRLRHNLTGGSGKQAASSQQQRHARQPSSSSGPQSGPICNGMSRSMVESQLKFALSSSAIGDKPMSNGHQARLSIPPQQHLQQVFAAAANGNGHPQYAAILAAQQQQQQMSRTGSSSARSSKSESPYACLIQRTDHHAATQGPHPNSLHRLNLTSSSSVRSDCSGTSPTSVQSAPVGRVTQPVPPFSGGSGGGAYVHNMLVKAGVSEEEAAQGSQWSLASSSSSACFSAEDRYQSEIRKLQREVDSYKDKVQTLVTQQSTYDCVVSAFEQSLETMKRRLNTLLTTSEQKDSELMEMRQAMDQLYSVCRQSGINVEQFFSPNLQRRHTFNTNNSDAGSVSGASTQGALARHPSNESMNSLVSQRSSVSTTSSSQSKQDKKAQKKSWLRSSFSKAFSKGKKQKQSVGGGSLSDVEEGSTASLHHVPMRGPNATQSDASNPTSPAHTPRHSTAGSIKSANSSSNLSNLAPEELVQRLQKELDEREMALTDLRLEALTSAHSMDQVRDELNNYKAKMMELMSDNERLRAQMTSRNSSQTSLPLLPGGLDQDNPAFSDCRPGASSELSVPHSIDVSMMGGDYGEGHRVVVAVNLGLHGDPHRFITDFSSCTGEVLISSVAISTKTKWDLLDSIVERLFKEYLLRVDRENLGLGGSSIVGYSVGQTLRLLQNSPPDCMPSESLLGPEQTHTIRLILKGVISDAIDALVFETLIPKCFIQRLLSSLLEKKRMLLSGPCGTGKSYLAQKLAEYILLRHGKEPNGKHVVTYNLDAKNQGDLKRYLSDLVNKIDNPNNNGEVPVVLILDNLHQVESLSDSFSPLLSIRPLDFLYIIATTNMPCSTTFLQVHHSFRIQLWGNHMEPVKGFLGRYLQRKLVAKEVAARMAFPELKRIIDWLPKAWAHINKFLEQVSKSSEVTIGPRLFLSCPMDIQGSREAFIELWNHSIVPYLLEAAKEAKQLNYLQCVDSAFEDPATEIIRTWPWTEPPDEDFVRLRLEDLGGDIQPPTLHPPPPHRSQHKSIDLSWEENDPLAMLLRLREKQAEEEEDLTETTLTAEKIVATS